MKHPLLFFAILLLGQLCFFGCRKDDAPGGCQPLTGESIYPQDSIVALSAKLKGDCLKLKVDYRGGCADHNFALLWTGFPTLPYPPRTGVKLLHDDGGDTCDEIKTVRLAFDLGHFGIDDEVPVTFTLEASGVASQRFEY